MVSAPEKTDPIHGVNIMGQKNFKNVGFSSASYLQIPWTRGLLTTYMGA